jgi:hypothetical protein
MEMDKMICSFCAGRGWIDCNVNAAYIMAGQDDLCPECKGTGEIIPDTLPESEVPEASPQPLSDDAYKEMLAKVLRPTRDDSMREYHTAAIKELYRIFNIDGSDGEIRFKWAALAASATVDDMRRAWAALEKLKSYNEDIRDGKINYRPEDHLQVINEVLKLDPYIK